MVKKSQKPNSQSKSGGPLGSSVKDSAQQIWQAGLGAFNKAQAEGSKAFESLVKEGISIQRKTHAAAEGKLSEASNKMSHMATDISSKAAGQWDKLENIFEERVAKALNKLGVPSAKDVSALIARIDELNQSVQKLSTKAAKPVAAAPAAPTTGGKRVVAKSSSSTASVKTAVKTTGKATAKAPAKAAAKKPVAAQPGNSAA